MAEETKVISRLQVDYQQAIESTKQFAASLAALNQQLNQIKRENKTVAEQLSNMFRGGLVDQFGRPLQQITQTAKEATQTIKIATKEAGQTIQRDLEKQLARIDANLARVAERAQSLGVTIKGLAERQQFIKSLRDSNATIDNLTDAQKKAIAEAERFAQIQGYNVSVLKSELNIIKEKKKATEMAALAAEKEKQARMEAMQSALRELTRVQTVAAQIQSKLQGTTLEGGLIWKQAEAIKETSRQLQNRLDKEKQVSDVLGQQITQLKEQAYFVREAAKQATAGGVLKIPTLADITEMEKTIARIQERGAVIGVPTDFRVEMQLLETLRQKIAASKEVSEEEVKQFYLAQQTLAVRRNEIATLESKANAMARVTAAQEAEARAQLMAEETMSRTLAELADLEARLRGKGLMGTTYGQEVLQRRAELETLRQNLRVNQALTEEERKQTNEIAKRVNILRNYVRAEEIDAQGAKRRTETFWQRRVGWFVAGLGFYGGLNALRDTIKTIGDVEMGMTQIARVIEDTNFSFAGMREELFKLGKEYGMTFDKIQDIALRWAQAGYNMHDTLELTRDSLLALNTAELDAEQATSGLIAIMAQWGLTADQLLPVIDKINKVADDFAITSEDLVAGLTRSGGAAKVLGLTLEQTIAILTVMREATGRTGKEVGNALNSILSFIQRPKSIELFEKEGIKVWADEAKTTFRNVIDIFSDLAQRWPQMSQATQDMFVDAAEQAGLYTEEIAELTGTMKEFTDAQQRDLSQAAAGIYRRNYLLALLQNWSKINQVLLSQEQALGYSLKENQRTMETYQKKVEQLKVAYQELQVAIGESGLLDNLKGIVDVAREGVEWLNKADPTIKNFVVNLGMIAGAIATINTLLRIMGGVEIIKMGAALSEQIEIATKGVTGLKAALAGLGVFIKANLPLLAVTGALTVLGTVLTEMRQQEQKMREQAATAGQLLERYEQIQKRLSGLTEGTKQYTDALQDLQSIKLDIFAQFPEVMKDGIVDIEKLRGIATAFDDIGKSVQQSVSVIEQYNKQVDSLTQEINTLERNKNPLQELAQKHRELSRALNEEKESSEEASQKKDALAQIEQGIIGVIGKEGYERLKAAGFTVEAVNKEIEAINKKIQAKNQEQKAIAENEKAMTQTMIRETITRMNAALLEAQAMAERAQALRQSWMANDSNLLNMTQFVESYKAEQQSQYYLNKAKEYQQLITKLQSHLNDLTQTQGKASRAAGVSAGETGKLTDAIRRYIDTVMEAVDAIEELNNQRQREIDLVQARIDYFGREGATFDSLLRSLEEQGRYIGLVIEKQRGLHEEANAVRSAIAQLEAKLRTLNTSTDEGKQAAEELTSQIQQLKDRANQLSVEWWNLQKILAGGISTEERLRREREAEIETLQAQYEYLTREKASKEELNRADAVRADLIRLYAEQQADLNKRLAEQQKYVATLEGEQKKLDLTTQQGKTMYGYYNKAIAEAKDKLKELTAELYNTKKAQEDLTLSMTASQRQIEKTIESIEDYYKRGLLSLTDYLKALQNLQGMPGLTLDQLSNVRRLFSEGLAQKWEQELESALEKAKKEFEQAMQAIDEEIKRVQDNLDNTTKSLDNLFATLEKRQQQFSYGRTRSLLQESLNALLGIDQTFAMPTTQDLINLVQNALNTFQMGNISGLSPEQLARVIGRDLNMLQDASETVQAYIHDINKSTENTLANIEQQIKQVNDSAEQQIASLKAEIESVNAQLKEELAILQQQLDALEEQEKLDERAKATEEYNKRIKALQDERAWYVLKGEEKYAFEIAAIDRQLAEERAKWNEQLKEWSLQDERDRIRAEMDAAKERAKIREDELNNLIKTIQQERDARLAELEAQRQDMETQKKLFLEALTNLQQYIEAEIEARRSAVEEEKQILEERAQRQIDRLNEEKERLQEHWNDKEEGIRAIMLKGLLDTIADMAAQDEKFLKRGQAIIDNIIIGIRSRKDDLQDEIEELNDMINQIHSSYRSDVLSSIEPSRPWEDSGFYADPGYQEFMRETYGGNWYTKSNALGAFIKRGPVYEIGEAGSEIILPLTRAIPVLSDALTQAVKQLQTNYILGQPDFSTLERAIVQMTRELGNKIPRELVAIIQLDGEVIAKKTISIMNNAIRQPIRKG